MHAGDEDGYTMCVQAVPLKRSPMTFDFNTPVFSLIDENGHGNHDTINYTKELTHGMNEATTIPFDI